MVVDYLSKSSANFAIPEPCLIHLTMKVRTATCAGARAAKQAEIAEVVGGKTDGLEDLWFGHGDALSGKRSFGHLFPFGKRKATTSESEPRCRWRS
jgi:hypothetical protein